MQTRLIARVTAFGLSAIVTLAMLGSVDLLAAVEPAPAGLIAAVAPTGA